MNRKSVSCILFLGLALPACAEEQLVAPDTSADVVALVQQVDGAKVLVLEGSAGEQFPEDYDCSDQSALSVTSATEIRVRSSSDSWHTGSAADLRPGKIIGAWIVDTELRSCPRQVTATRIDILE